MADLLARFGAGDVALLERLMGPAAREGAAVAPDRVVLDAPVAAAQPRYVELTRHAGVPLLIDPQTHYLQDVQHVGDPWARLPYASASAHTPADLTSPARQDELVAGCLEYQLEHGASALLPPYVHIERDDDGWIEVQTALWRRTRRYLDRHHLVLPVVAVTAVGWRLLDRTRWPGGIDRLAAVLDDLGADEIALAASRVDQGARPDDRLVGLVATVRRLRGQAPVLAWQQGLLGEAAVAAGAAGYETGIGWRERCDLRTAAAAHRRPPVDGARFGARPVYIPALGRSIPKSTLQTLLGTRLSAQLLCMDHRCCPEGPASLLSDARGHALTSRARSLHTLDRISRHAWRWHHLADTNTEALQLAERINTLASRRPDITRVNTNALRAVQVVADNRRQTLGRRRAA
ncbi:hypothetical protein GCM10027451_25860 [Geodermatophilus aquaeductus]|uniref:Uncharacterized protein n=1 Tax=Geodermatophilus aquaeductus TaxID=1564161 RepID=A0A521EMC3_9ACTN|nr:hypothetical protein [Geodermatophilus aquaeductus]SMO84591.1 hypothetical protein SAMN06273567_105231 [Geodermatophilus aquaeductus]